MQKINYDSGIKLTDNDKALLNVLGTIVEGVAEAFGDNCEVLIHSLEDLSHSCIKIEHGHVSGRTLGSPVTNLGIEILKRINLLESDVVGSYYTRLEDGRTLRSVTIIVRNFEGKPIAFMCINIDLSVPFIKLISGLLPREGESALTIEHFPPTIKELTSRMLTRAMTDISSRNDVSNASKNKMVVFELYNKGIFNVRGSVDIVAKEMGISRYTVYNYIREAKMESREQQ